MTVLRQSQAIRPSFPVTTDVGSGCVRTTNTCRTKVSAEEFFRKLLSCGHLTVIDQIFTRYFCAAAKRVQRAMHVAERLRAHGVEVDTSAAYPSPSQYAIEKEWGHAEFHTVSVVLSDRLQLGKDASLKHEH